METMHTSTDYPGERIDCYESSESQDSIFSNLENGQPSRTRHVATRRRFAERAAADKQRLDWAA